MKKTDRGALRFGSKVLPFDQKGDFFFRRGLNKLDNNNLPEAMAYYRMALLKDPENIEIKLAIAETLTEMERFEESNRLLFTLFTNEEDRPSEYYFGMGCNFVGMQDYEHARDSFLRYLQLEPDGEFMYDAYDMLDVLEEEPDELDGDAETLRRTTEARELMEHDDYKGAIRIMQEVLNAHPELIYVKNHLALAYFCNRDFKNATEQVRQILQDEPANIQAHCNLAIFLRAAHNRDEAHREADQLLDTRTDDPDDINRICITLMELGRFKDAYAFAKRLILLMPYDTGVIHRYAVCAYENGDYVKAADCYDRLLKLDDTDSVARYYRGVCRAAAMGNRRRGGFMFNYQVPLDEMLRRIHRLNELVNRPHDELLRMWKNGRELYSLARWGADMPEPSVKHAILALVYSFGDVRAEAFLRDFVLQHSQPAELKREAFGMLKQMGAKEPYMGYIDGELVESKVNLLSSLSNDVPDEYQQVIEMCLTYMQGERSETLLLAAAERWGEYVGSLDGFAALSRARVYAFAAALEYIVCRESDAKLTKSAMCKKYGVTLVRFNSALAQLMQKEKGI